MNSPAKRFIIAGLVFFQGLISAARAADYPLYLRFIPYGPPNLHLRIDRATTAYYVPGMNAGVTYHFDLTPAVTGTLSLAAGPIPLTLAVYRTPANCAGAKNVTVNVQYNIGGAFIQIGSQTRLINVPTSGAAVPTFSFDGIVSANTHLLSAGDFIRISVTADTTRLCLVNEYPLGGNSSDASHGIFQTGPMLNVSKSSVVLSDPVRGTTQPMAIPGATVRYTINVQNDAGASATGSNVITTDLIPSSTTYRVGSMTLNATPLSDLADADGGEFDGSAIHVDLGDMAPGDSHTVTFEVVLN